MLSGFNTDVDRSGVTVHVQTEDKGTAAAVVESLVYLGGQILECRKSSYRELVEQGKGREEILAVMDAQHRGLIEEIRAGAYDDRLPRLKAEPRAASEKPQPPSEAESAAPSEAVEVVPPPDAKAEESAETGASGPPQAVAPDRSVPSGERSPTGSPPLDEMVLDYLNTEEEQEGLHLTLDREQGLELGESAVVELSASTRHGGEPQPGVEVTVKIISTASEPATLAQGTTDERGLLRLEFRIPELRHGFGALIITGRCDLGDYDIKRLL